jgi:DNA sulfur modification protein DndC
MIIPQQIKDLIQAGALFVINSSAGKDSQAMTILLSKIIPKNQLVIVHVHLPLVEWDNSVEHIEATAFGIPVRVCTAVKTFFEMVERRGMFPDKSRRQCTSDLKRGPIEKEIRAILRERGLNLVVSCEGMRAQESTGRALLEPFKKYEAQSIAGRSWYKWLPIFDMSTDQVFATIEEAGQKPFWTYAEGMTRKSCCFCIMANRGDLRIAKRLRPELFAKYVALEKKLGHTLQMSGSNLEELTKL